MQTNSAEVGLFMYKLRAHEDALRRIRAHEDA